MKSTQFKVESFFGGIIYKDKIRQDQINKPNNFSAKLMWI